MPRLHGRTTGMRRADGFKAAKMTPDAAARMLPAMPRRTLLSLLGLAASALAAQATGLPCQPCGGLRLAAPPVLLAPATAGATAALPTAPAAGAATPAAPTGGSGGLLGLLRSQHLEPGSPLFIAWEVPLPAIAGPAPAAPQPSTAPGPGHPARPAGGAAAGSAGAGAASGPSAAGAAANPSTPSSPELAAMGAAARAVAAAGATPWLSLVFHTPAPLARNLAQLQGELSAAAEVAAAAARGTWFQVVWQPAALAPGGGTGGATAAGGQAFNAAEYAFLLKRAAVAVGGAQANIHVATMPLPADPAAIAAFYGAEVAAYVDLVALAAGGPAMQARPATPTSPGGAANPAAPAGASPADALLAAAVQKVHELDPGRPLALDALPYPAAPAGAVLAEAARQATAGFDLTFFRAPGAPGGAGVDAAPGAPSAAAPAITAATLNPLALLAREFAGDLSYDPGSTPTGAAAAWVFVRGKDLSLRVIAAMPGAPAGSSPEAAPGPPGGETAGAPGSAPTPAPPTALLHFPDPGLRRPTRFPFAAGSVAPPTGTLTSAPHAGLDVLVPDPGPVFVLGIERLTAAERQGVAEKINVASQRELPVEEILKRLQLFEEAQHRRLEDYTAINATHLRFQPNAGVASIEASLTGPFFWSREGGADWAWESLYINGVRWRGKTLPEIPLIQPEKAAALPLEILFTREYRYHLRGSEKIGGREAWVVDFAPAGTGAGRRRLYQGTVWIDREIYARLRTRGVQVELQGEVTSNEETLEYSPIDEQGRPAPWSPESFVLPLHLVAQQILSVLDEPLLVERETFLTKVQVNPPDFAAREKTVEDSDVTMVRDTDQGLRYLVKKGPGPRVVKEGFAPSKLFAVAGLFVDDSLSYPLPLAGLNYFTFDFKNSGKQINVFFGGALLVASAAQPRLFDSRFDAGSDVFAIAVPFTDDVYQKGKELVNQEMRIRPATFDLKLGHPLGDFTRIGLEYDLLDSVYSRNSNTDRQFVLPSDNLLQSVGGNLSFARAGYTLAGHYSYSMRSSWHAWGLPGNPDFSPDDRDFTRYNVTASKNWYLPFFQKIGVEVDYLAGDHLDRFSKYEFGFFGGTRIQGYRSNAVRASSGYLSHLSYGFDFGDVFRLDALVDGALATDRETGLHDTLLAGTGIAGTVMGPWQTLVMIDAGVPVAGPDHGFVLYLVFLKLFG